MLTHLKLLRQHTNIELVFTSQAACILTQSTVFYERVKLYITLANVFVLMHTLLCNIVRYFKYLLFRHNLLANELGYLVEICSYLHITL